MATYKEIQNYVKNTYGYQPKTCWIAHMKEVCGLNPKTAPNRISHSERKHPCPLNKQSDIKNVFRYFKMID